MSRPPPPFSPIENRRDRTTWKTSPARMYSFAVSTAPRNVATGMSVSMIGSPPPGPFGGSRGGRRRSYRSSTLPPAPPRTAPAPPHPRAPLPPPPLVPARDHGRHGPAADERVATDPLAALDALEEESVSPAAPPEDDR